MSHQKILESVYDVKECAHTAIGTKNWLQVLITIHVEELHT